MRRDRMRSCSYGKLFYGSMPYLIMDALILELVPVPTPGNLYICRWP